MKVKIKTFDNKPLFYETSWACWFDFKCSQEITISPKEFKLVETWTVVEVPLWYMLLTLPRSSTFKKYWLMQVNSWWVIDCDYCWDNDTIKFPFINMSDKPVTLQVGERIWQWVFVKIETPEFELVEKMWNKDRWWFWTTWIWI